MSERDAKEQGLQLIPRWWPILTAILAAACAVGASAATNGTVNAEQDRRITTLEQTIFQVNERLSRIEGALGVKKP